LPKPDLAGSTWIPKLSSIKGAPKLWKTKVDQAAQPWKVSVLKKTRFPESRLTSLTQSRKNRNLYGENGDLLAFPQAHSFDASQ